MQRDVVVVERIDELGHRAIGTTLAFSSVDLLGEVIATDDEVLVRRHDWTTRCWRQQVVGRQHEHACFGLGFNRQRQVHCHLVAVEVSVERGAHEWVQVNGFAFHQLWLECLNTQTVQGWCTVEQHGVFFDDFFEHVPHERVTTLDHALGALDVLGQTTIIQLAHHEWLEQLERHQLRQTTLVQTQCWAGDDNRAAGIVDTLAEQVLAETALLALQHVRQRLERTVACTRDRATTTAVVEQGVGCFLQHAAFVVENDFWRRQLQQALEAVVAVDEAAIEVVQVARCESATVELHHWAQIWRNHRNGIKNHGLRIIDQTALIIALVERCNNLESLDGLGLALR